MVVVSDARSHVSEAGLPLYAAAWCDDGFNAFERETDATVRDSDRAETDDAMRARGSGVFFVADSDTPGTPDVQRIENEVKSTRQKPPSSSSFTARSQRRARVSAQRFFVDRESAGGTTTFMS